MTMKIEITTPDGRIKSVTKSQLKRLFDQVKKDVEEKRSITSGSGLSAAMAANYCEQVGYSYSLKAYAIGMGHRYFFERMEHEQN